MRSSCALPRCLEVARVPYDPRTGVAYRQPRQTSAHVSQRRSSRSAVLPLLRLSDLGILFIGKGYYKQFDTRLPNGRR
jgi:hypothetical protein